MNSVSQFTFSFTVHFHFHVEQAAMHNEIQLTASAYAVIFGFPQMLLP